jgi:hypothetical protein
MTATNYVANKHTSLAITLKTFTIVMERRTLKNVNNCPNTNIYSYL